MNVRAVADDLRGDFVGLEHGAGKARRPMAEGRHAVEKVGGVPRPRGYGRERFVVGGRRVTERYAVPARRQPPHEIQAAVQFRGDGHDPDVGRRPLDLAKDVGPFKPTCPT